jgi:hypothetical protein
MTPLAIADNDCCFDWAGATDKNPSPNGWAQCTPTLKGACFARDGIQAYLVDYTCVEDSMSPDDESPDSGNGFACSPKGGGTSEFISRKFTETHPSALATQGNEQVVFFETDVPTVSQWGLAVMLLLVLSAGTIAILRRKPAVV